MMAQCTAQAQLKYVYGVSRVMYHREPGPPIFMSSEGLQIHMVVGEEVFPVCIPVSVLTTSLF